MPFFEVVWTDPTADFGVGSLLRTSWSETPPVATAWVSLVREGNDVEAKGFAVQVAGSHLLIRPRLLASPLDIPLPSDLRLGPESVCECTQGMPHHPLPSSRSPDETP